MNISNVVLDRDNESVTFDTVEDGELVKPVHYIEDRFAWESRITGKYCDAITAALVGVPRHAKYDLTPVESILTQAKQPRYLKEDGTDTIDKWAATRSHEVFREIMYAQVEKYKDRLGEKDPILEEVTKMADYMNRWVEYEKIWDKE